MSIDTVVDSPGSSDTFAKPLSSLTGRVTELTRSRTYIWTTSVPTRLPELTKVAVTRVASPRVIVDRSSLTSLTRNVV